MTDAPYSDVDACVWSVVEVCMGILGASLPTYRPLFLRIVGRESASSGLSSKNIRGSIWSSNKKVAPDAVEGEDSVQLRTTVAAVKSGAISSERSSRELDYGGRVPRRSSSEGPDSISKV